jgi:predicted exporter
VTGAAQRRLWARAALALYVGLCGAWLWKLDYAAKISTNVLDLVPNDERSPELGLVRHLAGDVQAKIMLFALTDPAHPAAPPVSAARAAAEALRREPAFAQATVMADASDQEVIGRLLYRLSSSLLLPTWLGEQARAFAQTGLAANRYPGWVAEKSAAALEAFLPRPEAMPMQELILSDPLLLLPNLIDRARGLSPDQGAGGGAAVIWAQIRASPLAEAGQDPVFAAIDRVEAELRRTHPGLKLRWTGVNRFAAASRAQIEREIKTLNLFSLLAVLAVACLFVRRIWQLIHLVPIVACSLLGAWTVSTLVFDRLHILVFVIGSLLSGVAIDYGFYIFMQPFADPEETYPHKLRRLLKPLLASCLTTVVGFSLLFFSDLPLLRQMGVFVSAGLLSALGAAMLYFAQLKRPYLEGRYYPRIAAGASGTRVRQAWRIMAGLAVLTAATGPWLLRWRDDVRELDVPHDALQQNDREVRKLFGDRPDRPAYITSGSNLAAARQNLADFTAFAGSGSMSLGLIFPTQSDYQALPQRMAKLAAFPGEFRSALARHGFLPESFNAFFIAWDAVRRSPPRTAYPQLYAEVSPALTGPLGMLYSGSADQGKRSAWFISILDRPLSRPAPPALHTVNVDELQSLNTLFAQYRWSALRLSLIGLALVIASVFVIYRGGRAVRIALIPAGSCFFIFGVMGFAGLTLNLFNLLGAFLGICLAHNYSIFSSDSAGRRTAPPVPVRLSGCCAAASFGVLAFSHIPVVHALGLTVSLIVLTALACVELEPMVRR